MTLSASFQPYQLKFKNPILTSRGSMEYKNGYFLYLKSGGATGVGEVSFIEGLSVDNLEHMEELLTNLCTGINEGKALSQFDFLNFPSVLFAWETAILDLDQGGKGVIFDSSFVRHQTGIPINGLIWMGSKEFMLNQISEKINQGFTCIKMKIGALPFDTEIDIISYIRTQFKAADMEIRLDANGAFSGFDALEKLKLLADFNIHSLEQPIKAGTPDLMAEVVAKSPIPIALDEELINWKNGDKRQLLSSIKPHYIILKPALLGGLKQCEGWIEAARDFNIGWWATSALESNIGLNAIAQWVATKNSSMIQGLGTGGLYTNNIPSPLYIENGKLWRRLSP